MNFKPFYSPWSFPYSSWLVFTSHPGQREWYTANPDRLDEQKHTDSLFIILGDFNRPHELPKYRQHVKCHNVLDYCYTILKDAYHSVSQAALGHSDHCLVIPTYRPKLKSAKPVVKTEKKRTNQKLTDKGDKSGKKKLHWKAEEQVSVERPTRHHTIQETIPPAV